MSDERGYRVMIRFDPQAESFTAQAPELDLTATGHTREAAVLELENALDARLQGAVDGEPMPPPAEVREVSGHLELDISHALHRELLFHASTQNLSVEALAAELIARGIGALDGVRRRPQHRDEPRRGDEQPRDDQRGEGRREGRGRGRREGYRPELDDKANFLEYLRNLEKGGGGGGGGGRGRGRR